MKDLLTSIVDAYGSEILRYEDFEKALQSAGYASDDATIVMNDLLKRHEIGRVSFRQVRKNKPRKRSFIAIIAKAKRN